MWGHVDGRLAPFCEGLLSGREVQSVEAHLARCARCEALRREVERGLALAGRLPAHRLPEERAERIRRLLADPAAAGRLEAAGAHARSRRGLLAAAAALFLAAAGIALVTLWRSPALRLEAAEGRLSSLEEAALALQRQEDSGTLALDLRTGSAAAVRRWVVERTGLSADVALERPAADAGRFDLLGAKEVTVAGRTTVAVVYRIDSRPAVLLTARASDVADRPPDWTLAGKKVRHRLDPSTGTRILTWSNIGQSYALVSELPDLGLDACHICHTDPGRRDLIRKMAPGS